MTGTWIPEGYKSKLGLYETQSAIAVIKETFQQSLSALLHLKRVSAPLFLDPADGMNDNLNGVERPVRFDIPSTGGDGEVVQSLAKWKRYALGRYGFLPGRGLYTDMNAIRRDETLDNLHSAYVDQWDWEKVILPEERTMETLVSAVSSIVDAIYYTGRVASARFEAIAPQISRDVRFISTESLRERWPSLTPKEREHRICRECGTVCVTRIGGLLSDGTRHDGRAPDYDDWSLNCDILMYNPLLDCAFELSSMGVRVDAQTLTRQLDETGCSERAELPFHRMLLSGALPQTIGGGIGQSRLCMLLLEKAHIGEVQSSLWDQKTLETCAKAGVTLL